MVTKTIARMAHRFKNNFDMYSCVLTLTAACMVSYHGHALDEKTPLLRASDAMSREGARLCQLLGMKVRLMTR